MRKILVIGFALSLSGCGAMNSYTSAILTSGASDYEGAKANVQKADDLGFAAWADSACDIKLGALKRNNTGNTNAVTAALYACPIPNPQKTLNGPSLNPTTAPTGTAN